MDARTRTPPLPKGLTEQRGLVAALGALAVLATLLADGAAAQADDRPWFQLVGVRSIGAEAERSAGVSIGDLDGDGHLDLIYANGRHWPGTNRIFWNNGRRGFTTSTDLAALRDTSYAASLGDLDGDGDLDVVVGNDLAANLVYLNLGNRRFSAGAPFGELDSTRSAQLADLDGDGHLDVVLTNRAMPNRIHFGDGSGGFPRSSSFGTADDSTIAVAIADVDEDGDLDLLLANRDRQPNQVQLGDGKGSFSAGAQFGTGSDETRAIAAGDLDGDGDTDLVLANIQETNAVLLGDGTGRFERRVPFGAADAHSYSVALADLDGNGQLDIVIGNADRRNVALLVSRTRRSLSFEAFPFGEDSSVTYGLAVGDLDSDGIPEIVTANSDGLNGLFLNVGRSRRP